MYFSLIKFSLYILTVSFFSQISENVGIFTCNIVRLLGARGVVRIPYYTEEGSAKAGGEDFEDSAGELEFGNDEFV